MTLARRLMNEHEYPEAFKPRAGFWELSFNDRVELPNDTATDRLLRLAVDAALDSLLGAGSYMIIRQSDAYRRYGFMIHRNGVDCLDTRLGKLVTCNQCLFRYSAPRSAFSSSRAYRGNNLGFAPH